MDLRHEDIGPGAHLVDDGCGGAGPDGPVIARLLVLVDIATNRADPIAHHLENRLEFGFHQMRHHTPVGAEFRGAKRPTAMRTDKSGRVGQVPDTHREGYRLAVHIHNDLAVTRSCRNYVVFVAINMS